MVQFHTTFAKRALTACAAALLALSIWQLITVYKALETMARAESYITRLGTIQTERPINRKSYDDTVLQLSHLEPDKTKLPSKFVDPPAIGAGIIARSRQEIFLALQRASLLSSTGLLLCLALFASTQERNQRTKSSANSDVAQAAQAELILQNTADVVCTLSPNFSILTINQACLSRWGFTPEELIGTSLLQRITGMHEGEFREKLGTMARMQIQWTHETQIQSKTGQVIDVLISTQWSPKLSAMFCTIHDISKQKELELARQRNADLLQAILERMPFGLILCSGNGSIETANPTAEALLETQRSDLLGTNITKYLRDDPSRTNADELAFESVLDVQELRDMILIASSGYRSIQIASTKIDTDSGVKVLVGFADMSAKQKIEDARREMIAMVTHDVKSPLGSFKALIQNFLDGIYGQMQPEASLMLKLADEDIGRTVRLINELLDAEMLSSGKFALRLKDESVEELLNVSLQAVQQLALVRRLQITSKHDVAQIHGDGARLVQVLINLLSNAIKYSRPGGQINVSVRQQNNDIMFEVADTGMGIPAEHKAMLFEKFTFAHGGLSKSLGGSGLGLAICKNIVEQHGGSITVESEQGKGSTFRFKIPSATTTN